MIFFLIQSASDEGHTTYFPGEITAANKWFHTNSKNAIDYIIEGLNLLLLGEEANHFLSTT